MSTVRMNASAIGGTIQTAFSGNITVPTNGLITVDTRDVTTLLARGCTFFNSRSARQTFATAPRVASTARIVSSAALSNGTYAIANQPDVPRVLGIRVDPGTTAITAGAVAVSYVANDGSTQVDTVALAAAASTPFTTNTSKGVLLVNSATVSALAGGTSPKFQINDTNILALQVDPGFVDFTIVRAEVDGVNEAIGTVASTSAGITPTTTPDGTHTFGYFFNWNAPDV